MQKATAESPQERQPMALLIQGPPGGGKTTLALQFPRPYILDIDLNMQGPLRVLKQKNPKYEYFYDEVAFRIVNGKKEEVPKPDRWQRIKDLSEEAFASPEVGTVIVDGLTHLNDILISKVLADMKKSEPDVSIWIPFRKQLMDYIMKCRSHNKNFVMLCHEEPNYETDKKNIMLKTLISRTPVVNSGIGNYFGAFFTDMWRCESRLGPGNKPRFFVQFSKTLYDDLKNSYGQVGEYDFTDTGFAEINKVLKLV